MVDLFYTPSEDNYSCYKRRIIEYSLCSECLGYLTEFSSAEKVVINNRVSELTEETKYKPAIS